jgi:hypothetical protein
MSDNNESQSKDAVVKACWAEQVELRPIQANSKIYFTIKPTETGWDICIPEDVTLTEAAQRFIAAVDEMRGHSSKPATSTTQWISVKDRLPEHDKCVLWLTGTYGQWDCGRAKRSCTNSLCATGCGDYFSEGCEFLGTLHDRDKEHATPWVWSWQGNSTLPLKTFSYWMPLPQPPEDEA